MAMLRMIYGGEWSAQSVELRTVCKHHDNIGCCVPPCTSHGREQEHAYSMSTHFFFMMKILSCRTLPMGLNVLVRNINFEIQIEDFSFSYNG